MTIALNIYQITPILKGTYPQDTPIGQICLQTKVTPNKDHMLALFLGFTLAIRVSQIDQKSEFLYLTLTTGSYMLDEPQEHNYRPINDILAPISSFILYIPDICHF